jgi:hypothetical protein
VTVDLPGIGALVGRIGIRIAFAFVHIAHRSSRVTPRRQNARHDVVGDLVDVEVSGVLDLHVSREVEVGARGVGASPLSP